MSVRPQHGKRKQSLYFPKEALDEIQREALRLDRSISWVVQRAFAIARAELARMPAKQKIATS